MPLNWSDPQLSEIWDGYLEWSHELRARQIAGPVAPSNTFHEPVFLRLHQGPGKREALKALIDDPSSAYLMDEQDYSVLSDRINGTLSDGLADEFLTYRKHGTSGRDQKALFDVLDLGTAQRMIQGHSQPIADAQEQTWAKGQPIVAAIDDGIGFLNARFRRIDPATGSHQTRFSAIWLQSRESLSSEDAKTAACGQILNNTDIDALLRGGRVDEPSAYARLNASMFDITAHRSVEFSASHGTQMLDLAGGADPADQVDPALNWPLLAVQLPPESVEDTSGTRFETYLVQGVRWILRRAKNLDPSSPVIINISMGMLAGPKDGTRFAEYQITREARLWQAATGQPVRIVWAFGNSRRSRQVARLPLPAKDTSTLTWRVQPDDLTAGYIELRSDSPNGTGAFDVSLTAPGGETSLFQAMQHGSQRTLSIQGKPIARMYHVPPRARDAKTTCHAHYVIAVCPTGDTGPGLPCAPSGAWTVSVRSTGSVDQTVTLQIQRGDSLPGFRPKGRQSYFDDQAAWEWDTEMQDTSGLGVNCPVTREGTQSALTTATSRQVFTVAAARHVPGARKAAAVWYSSEGAEWCVAGPTLSTIAENTTALTGVGASGSLTGSVRSSNGTSTAAARLTRALAMSADRIKTNRDLINTSHTDDLDPDKIKWVSVPEAWKSRLGAITLSA